MIEAELLYTPPMECHALSDAVAVTSVPANKNTLLDGSNPVLMLPPRPAATAPRDAPVFSATMEMVSIVALDPPASAIVVPLNQIAGRELFGPAPGTKIGWFEVVA